MSKNTELPFANGQKVTLEENGKSCTINLIKEVQVENLERLIVFTEKNKIARVNKESVLDEFRSKSLKLFNDLDIADLLRKTLLFTVQHFEYVAEAPDRKSVV